MSCFDAPIEVKVGGDGLAIEDWDEIFTLTNRYAREMQERAAAHPSISARQLAANAEAMRLRVQDVWRRKINGAS